jgi:hypothetical protein
VRSSFKYNPEFEPDEPGAVIGDIPPGCVVDMRLEFGPEPYWLVVVDGENP